MITGEAGDVIIAHHQMVHNTCPNASSNIRYAAIARRTNSLLLLIERIRVVPVFNHGLQFLPERIRDLRAPCFRV